MFCLFNGLFFNILNNKKKYDYILYKNMNYNVKFNMLSFGKFFNDKNLIINNNLSYLFKFKKKHFYVFSDLNKNLFKLFFEFTQNIFNNKNNLLFIDSNYKMYTPLYNFIYNLKSIYEKRQFFFLKKEFLTLNNWLYNYNNFLNKNNINCLVFLDYCEYKNFFNIFNKFNLPIISIVPNNIKPVYIDYFFFINKNDLYFFKIISFNIISNNFFKSYKYNQYILKNKYLFLFKKKNENSLLN